MEYISEMRAFNDYLLLNHLPTGSIALWYALMHVNNKVFWKTKFAAPNIVLQQITGLTKTGIFNARNRLKQEGLIDYIPGKRGAAGTYTMYSISNIMRKSEPSGEQVDELIDGSIDESVDEPIGEPLIIHNTKTKTKTKTNTKNNTPHISPQPKKEKPPKVQYAEFVSMTNVQYETLIAKFGEAKTKGCIEILDNYKGSTGKKYKDDYRTILNWVGERYDERQKNRPGQIPTDYGDFD